MSPPVGPGRDASPDPQAGSYLIASIQSAPTEADLVQLRESLVEQVDGIAPAV